MNELLRMKLICLKKQIDLLTFKLREANIIYNYILYYLDDIEYDFDEARDNYDSKPSRRNIKKLITTEDRFNWFKEFADDERHEIFFMEQKLKGLWDEYNKLMKEDLVSQCKHPICYNTGYFIKNNPITPMPRELANYSIDYCLECARQKGVYRERNQKGKPDWYNPPYICVEYNDGKSFNELHDEYLRLSLNNPEDEAIRQVLNYVEVKQGSSLVK